MQIESTIEKGKSTTSILIANCKYLRIRYVGKLDRLLLEEKKPISTQKMATPCLPLIPFKAKEYVFHRTDNSGQKPAIKCVITTISNAMALSDSIHPILFDCIFMIKTLILYYKKQLCHILGHHILYQIQHSHNHMYAIQGQETSVHYIPWKCEHLSFAQRIPACQHGF